MPSLSRQTLPVWYLQCGEAGPGTTFDIRGQASAVLVTVKNTTTQAIHKLLVTAQHALRSGGDQRTGPWHPAFLAWQPNAGYNPATAIPVTVFAGLTPDSTLPLAEAEDFAFLELPRDATGSLSARLLPDMDCVPGLQSLNIVGFVDGQEIILNHNGRIEAGEHPHWRFVSHNNANAICVLAPGDGTPKAGASGGGVFRGEQYAGVYRGQFTRAGEHIFVPVSRIREWCRARGYTLVPMVEQLTEVISDNFDVKQLTNLLSLSMGTDYKNLVPEGLTPPQAVQKLLSDFSSRDLITVFIDQLLAAQARNVPVASALQEIRDTFPSAVPQPAVQIAAMRSGLEKVGQQLDDPEIVKLVQDSGDFLITFASQITILRAYKTLHDCLHGLQFNLRGFATALRLLREDPSNAEELSHTVASLATKITDAEAAIPELPDSPPSIQETENDWVKELRRITDLTQAAMDTAEHLTGRRALQMLRSLLSLHLTRIDGELRKATNAINLAKLQELFAQAAAIDSLQLPVLQALQHGESACERLQQQLRSRVNQHSSWQSIDRSLWGADAFLDIIAQDSADFDAMWIGLSTGINELLEIDPASVWATRLRDLLEKVNASRQTEDWKLVVRAFSTFRDQASAQFYALDGDLKRLAGQVYVLSRPLARLLTFLQNPPPAP